MRYRRQPDSFWHVVFFIGLLIVLFLLWGTQTASGQSMNTSEPPSLTVLLQACEENLQLLVTRLDERTLQVADLRENLKQAEEKLTTSQESLTVLRGQLETAEQSLTQLRTDLQVTLTSRDALLKQYNALEASWTDYRTEMKKQITEVQRERNRAKAFAWAFGIGTAAGAVACVIMALK